MSKPAHYRDDNGKIVIVTVLELSHKMVTLVDNRPHTEPTAFISFESGKIEEVDLDRLLFRTTASNKSHGSR